MGAEYMTILSIVMKKRFPEFFHLNGNATASSSIRSVCSCAGRACEGKRNIVLYGSLLQTELSEKVIADRKEKFDNPAILLGLMNDEIVIA